MTTSIIRYYEAYGYCESHKTKHYATISTGHSKMQLPAGVPQQMRDALESDLIEEYPWCHERGMKIKVTDITNKVGA